MWDHCKPAVSASNMDLDVMFDFLKEERSEMNLSQTKETALNQINEEFDSLDSMWKEAEKVNIWATSF